MSRREIGQSINNIAAHKAYEIENGEQEKFNRSEVARLVHDAFVEGALLHDEIISNQEEAG